eukprot:gene4826-8412_t
MKLLKIGVVGFSREKYDKKEAIENIDLLISKMVSFYKPKEVEIVSGLTNQGIPKLSYEYALTMKYKTIGIAPTRAKFVKRGVFEVNKEIIVGKDFGDESQTFIDYIDVLIRVGGGKQSREEVEIGLSF